MRRSLLGAACVLAGCTVIGTEQVKGWPELRIVEHRVPHAEMRARCTPYAGAGMGAEACAEFNFAAKRCDLWFSADFPPPQWMIEHERLHCLGYDHIGGATMRDLLER